MQKADWVFRWKNKAEFKLINFLLVISFYNNLYTRFFLLKYNHNRSYNNLYIGYFILLLMGLLEFLKQNENARRIFGQRELKIIEKQLLGVNLTQSEKNRLSRDIRKKFDFIRNAEKFENEFELKKGAIISKLINETIKEILDDKLKKDIKEIWLFGSAVENKLTNNSDIDICVLFKKINKRDAFKFRARIAGRVSDKIDIQVFDFLPLKIQKDILKRYKVLWKNE